MNILEECVAALANPNMRAFMRVIRAGESSQGDEAYRMIVGGGFFDSFDDHPRRLVHIKSLGVDSTAAGAYQFLSRTWDGCVKALSLPDFSPPIQDIAAVYLVRGRGALTDVLAGNLEVAIAKCAREWASLPGSPYGQPTRSMAQAKATYEQYGGAYAPAAPPAQAESQTNATSASAPQEKTMLPGLIGVLAGTLIDAFAPLAREKITREIGRHTDNAAVSDQVATAVIEAVKTATGKADPIEAVAAAQQDPAVMQLAETSALDTLDRIAPLLDKMHQWDKDAWTAEESSRAAAAARIKGDPHAEAIDLYLTRSIVRMGFGVLCGTAALMALLAYFEVNESLLIGLGTLFTTGATTLYNKLGTRFDHAYGSSRTSGAKDVTIAELSRRPKEKT